MSVKRKRTLAFCLSGSEFEYQCVILNTITNRCRELGYNVAVFYSMADNIARKMGDTGEADIYSLPNYDLFSGLIILGRQFNSEILSRITDSAKRSGIPIVTISRDIEGCYSVGFEYGDCMSKMVRHLHCVHGITQIGFMGGTDYDGLVQRLESYKAEMDKLGLSYDESRIGWCDYNPDIAEAETKRFMESAVPPRAIVCVNDATAILVCEALAAQGIKVPDDVAVTGFDGICEAYDASPKITTASADAVSAALKSVEIIDKLLNGEECQQKTTIPLVYEFSESCGCIKADVSRDHVTIRKLYSKLSATDEFSKNLLNFNEKMTKAKTKEEAIATIAGTVKKCWNRKSWLCVSADYFTDKTPDVYSDFTNGTRGYGERMEVIVHIVNGETAETGRFPTQELLPDFKTEIDECGVIIFAPLHSLGKTIGYFALNYIAPPERTLRERGFDMLHTWLMTICVVLENIRIHSELTSYAERINKLYITDPLTELYNRRGFYQLINREILPAAEKGSEFAVISSDLDNLKEINDGHGHKEGDFAIYSAADALRRAVGNDGICARFGGDEFVAFIPCCGKERVELIVEKVNGLLNEINEHSDKPYKVGISVGYASEKFTDDFYIDALISKADADMYTTKKVHKKVRIH